MTFGSASFISLLFVSPLSLGKPRSLLYQTWKTFRSSMPSSPTNGPLILLLMWVNHRHAGTWTQLSIKQLTNNCFPTDVFSAHPGWRLHRGSLLRAPSTVSELRKKCHLPTPFLPVLTAFTPGGQSSQQCSQGCGCCMCHFQKCHSSSTEGNYVGFLPCS